MPGIKKDGTLDLESRIREVSDRLSLSHSSSKAAGYRTVSSAIGAESPAGILAEIRESNERMIELMKESIAASLEKERRDEQRHKELCTLLLGLSLGSAGKDPATFQTQASGTYSAQSGNKAQSYYGSVALTSGVHAISCIMMHLDYMLTKHPQFRKIESTDKTFMDIKDWHSTCSSVVNADKNSKAGLRIPRPTDNDFKVACKIVASPVEGRRPACDSTHIASLVSQAPELMTTVEWVRQAILRCPGCLSPERHCRFRSITGPFVNDEMELDVAHMTKLTMPTRTRHQEVLDLKMTQRKAYMNLILEHSYTSSDALQRARDKA